MKVGIALPHYDFSFPDGRRASVEATTEWAVRAEELGYDSVWLSDHFFLDLARYGGPSQRYASVEPLTTLASIAAATKRVRVGTLVLCYAFRHPSMLAKEAASLDALSGGRLDLGLGAGWYEDEFTAMGIPFPPVGERVSALREYVQVVGGILGDAPFTFAGAHFQVLKAPGDPPPVQRPRPPIWIGSKGGARMLRTIAEHADGWNTVWRWTPAAYADVAAKLDAACAQAGRDPSSVRRSVGLLCLVGNDGKDLARRWDALQRWSPGGALDDTSLETFAADTLTGTPDECVARIKEFAALGVEEVILSFAALPFAVADPEHVEIVAREIIPVVRS
ncbi:MAG: LLM class flavin-dependent oxidoreductase [Actinomycetota bacterium]|nr:LLM class flavin-dependent oxidoreductase [Actinomycetota bacterium]